MTNSHPSSLLSRLLGNYWGKASMRWANLRRSSYASCHWHGYRQTFSSMAASKPHLRSSRTIWGVTLSNMKNNKLEGRTRDGREVKLTVKLMWNVAKNPNKCAVHFEPKASGSETALQDKDKKHIRSKIHKVHLIFKIINNTVFVDIGFVFCFFAVILELVFFFLKQFSFAKGL